jgi:hypothetical protein
MRRFPKDLGLIALALILLATGIYYWFGTSGQAPITLKLTAGDGSGLRHRLATEFSREAANCGIRLILHQRENIEQLAASQNHPVDEVWLEQSRTTTSNASPNA